MFSKTNDNTAAITAEVKTLTDADSALSTRIDAVLAKTSGNEVLITNQVKALTDKDTALGERELTPW